MEGFQVPRIGLGQLGMRPGRRRGARFGETYEQEEDALDSPSLQCLEEVLRT